ncbi:MAG: hypothetical protein GWP67_02875 [Gammaproteobacteria bacterium]|jgi:TolB-like protein/Flp pilus assembly protein TadD|nr:hypothetical protein [Gammaproteobacteria bacterium]
MSVYAELKRRNVIRVGTAYVAFSWLVIQVLETLLPIFGLSEATARVIVIILAIGLIPVLVLSWLFELTPEGLKREGEVDHGSSASVDSTRRLDRVVIVLLGAAVVYFAFDKFVLDPARDVEIVEEAMEQAQDKALLSSYGDHSVAVMAFSDLSANGDQEYFSDGIAEEIINLLSRIRNLRVIARSSAFSFKGQNLAASEIAERLNVRYVMEGSIRRAGDRLRITTTMIDASTDTQLWSENFDRDFGDIFAIQDEIAGEVVDMLEMQISGRLPSVNRVDPESYSLYLQARHALNSHQGEAVAEADRLLDRALEIDPGNVAAWVLYPTAYHSLEYWGRLTREEAIASSRRAIDQALQLDPGNTHALISQRQLEQVALDTWEGELDAATYGLSLLPTDIRANAHAAVYLSVFGEFEQSLEYSEYVLAKDPLCANCLRTYMLNLMAMGDYQKATEACNRYRSVTGGSGTYTLGIIQLLQGDAEKALETVEESSTHPFVMMQGRAMANWTLGRTAEYERALAELEASLDNEEFEKYRARPEDYLAGLYAWVGRKDDAFDILEALIDPPRSWGPIRWQVDPIFTSLHEHPRWLALREKEEVSRHHLESYQLDRRFPGPGKVPTYEVPDI